MPPDTVSHLNLLIELLRRVQKGERPANQDEWLNLYFDLTDAHERAIWAVQHQDTKWPEMEALNSSEILQ